MSNKGDVFVSEKPVRLRFAPSPTGSLHIGGVRLAIFNWLYARKHGGQHILRIEDTDQKRYVEDSVQGILRAFDWLGLTFDEGPHVGGDYGPYVQSERLDLYQHWANWLVDNGHAYKAFETAEDLQQISEERQKMGLPPGYDGRARSLTPEQIAEYEAEGRPYVIRFKMPQTGRTICEDAIRGKVDFDNDQLVDTILMKSDGYPTYHLAHIVDDHLMGISHVTRGVEWLPSFPLHWNMWEAFGWERPMFAHMPLILKPEGKGKLSKREAVLKDGTKVPSLAQDFIEGGYLPEATTNFLINIGWNYGDNVEIFSFEEAMERFDFSGINKANAAYPIQKLDAINGEYIRALPIDDLADRLQPVFEDAGYTVDRDLLRQLVPAIQTRMKVLTEAPELAGFLFADWQAFTIDDPTMLIQRKMDADGTITCLRASLTLIESIEDYTHDHLYAEFKKLAKELSVKNGQLFGTLRVALTAQKVSPPTFETMELLGKEETMRRVQLALDAMRELADS